MKPIKILFRLLFTLAFIVGIAIAGVVFLIDPNDYKDDIVQHVKNKTGRDLHIPGDITFSIYPWLGLKLGEVSLDNPETFARPLFAKMDSLDIRLSLQQVLNLQPEIGVLHIDGLNITLIKRNDGVSNWDDLISEESPDSTQTSNNPNTILKKLSISSFEIRDASINWLDETSKTDLLFNDVNLRTGVIRIAAPTTFDLSFATKLKEPEIDARIITSGKLTSQSDFSSITLNNWNFSLHASGEEVPNKQQRVQLSGNMIYGLSEQVANLIDIKVEVADMAAILDVNISQFDTDPFMKGKLIVPEYSMSNTLRRLGVALPAMADRNALSKVEILSDIEATSDSLILGNLILDVDDSQLEGGLKVEFGNTINANYTFSLDEIDLDKYLPPQVEADTQVDSAVDEPLNLPVDLIRRLNVKGDFSATSIKAMNVRMREITAKNVVRDNIAQVNLQVKKMYSGSGDILASIDARSKTPAVAVKSEFNNVQIEKLLKDYMDSEFVSGRGSLRFDIRSLAEKSGQLTSTMKGVADFSLVDGEVNGINIAEKLRQAEAFKDGIKYKKSREVNATDFTSLVGKANIKNGVVRFSDFNLKAPLLRAAVSGSTDIHNKKHNMKFEGYFVNTKTGQAGKQLSDVRSFRVPMTLTGTYDDPKFREGYSREVKEKAQTKVKKVKSSLKKEEKKVKSELKEKLQKEIKGSGLQEALQNLSDKF